MAREEGFFDELARGLADGTLTRGKALRLLGAALVGGTLASLGIREAAADPPGCKRNGGSTVRTTSSAVAAPVSAAPVNPQEPNSPAFVGSPKHSRRAARHPVMKTGFLPCVLPCVNSTEAYIP